MTGGGFGVFSVCLQEEVIWSPMPEKGTGRGCAVKKYWVVLYFYLE